MRPDCLTARSYQRFDSIIKTVEKWLKKEVVSAFGYSREAISRRIAQVMVTQTLTPFLRHSLKAPSELEKGFLSADGINVNVHDGVVRVDPRHFIRCTVKFLALWMLGLFYWVKSMLVWRRASTASVLLHGVPDADLHAGGSSKRFEQFCNEGPLPRLNQARRIIVQSTSQVLTDDPVKFSYARIPLLSLFGSGRLHAADSLRFLLAHFSLLPKYILATIRFPVLCLLWRDFALHEVAHTLDRRGLIADNMITNTNWLQQFLWMTDLPTDGFSTSLILYSLNSSGLVFKDDPTPNRHPGIRHLRADLIYIWDKDYERILREEQVFCKTEAVGPILWYLPPQLPDVPKRERLRVCIFDVSPFSKDTMQKNGLSGHFYSSGVMTQFLEHIIATINEVAAPFPMLEIILKHKRIPSPSHDSTYFDHVKLLCDTNDNLHLAPEDSNLYSLILESDIVVVIPYSSPAYVARHLNIPAVFYDPTGDILPAEFNSGIKFCSGRERLRDELNIHLNKRATA